jgi:hypothetical protein
MQRILIRILILDKIRIVNSKLSLTLRNLLCQVQNNITQLTYLLCVFPAFRFPENRCLGILLPIRRSDSPRHKENIVTCNLQPIVNALLYASSN